MKFLLLLCSLLSIHAGTVPFTSGGLSGDLDPLVPSDGGWQLHLFGPDISLYMNSSRVSPSLFFGGGSASEYVGASPFSAPGAGPFADGIATYGDITTTHFYISMAGNGQIWTGSVRLYADAELTMLLQSLAVEGWATDDTLVTTPAVWTRRVRFGENSVPEPATSLLVSAVLAGLVVPRMLRRLSIRGTDWDKIKRSKKDSQDNAYKSSAG